MIRFWNSWDIFTTLLGMQAPTGLFSTLGPFTFGSTSNLLYETARSNASYFVLFPFNTGNILYGRLWDLGLWHGKGHCFGRFVFGMANHYSSMVLSYIILDIC